MHKKNNKIIKKNWIFMRHTLRKNEEAGVLSYYCDQASSSLGLSLLTTHTTINLSLLTAIFQVVINYPPTPYSPACNALFWVFPSSLPLIPFNIKDIFVLV